jgi:hypothetical protein
MKSKNFFPKLQIKPAVKLFSAVGIEKFPIVQMRFLTFLIPKFKYL